MAQVTFDKLPQFTALVLEACNKGLTRAAGALSEKMKEGMSKGAPRTASAPGSPPNVQRGGLRNSIHGTQGVDLKAAAGSGIGYALTQERGGVITAKNTKMLPIPVNAAAQRLLEKFGSATTYYNGVSGTSWSRSPGLRYSGVQLHVIPRKGKPPLLVGNQGGRRSIAIQRGAGALNGVPVFVLKRSIKLPARPWALPALNKNKAHILNQFNLGAAAIVRRGIRSAIT